MHRRNLIAAASALPILSVAAPSSQLTTQTQTSMQSQELPSKPYLTLAAVKELLQAAESEARAKGLKVSVAIVDDGGHVCGVLRLDGAPPSTAAIAADKARTAALIRRPGKAFEDLINGGRLAMLSVAGLGSLLDGSQPLVMKDHCVGAVGISGGRPPEDNAVIDAVLRAWGS
jgi:glc operon protein GlcG